MSLLVTGSIGIDTVQTPHGNVADVPGGSAVYFAFAASFYTPVRLVGVVGADFPVEFRNILAERAAPPGRHGIDLTGLETRAGSNTFRWTGKYVGDMNQAETLKVQLNVLGELGPKIPDVFRDSQYVFLANTHPDLQRDLIGQLTKPKLVVCDTMNLWIETARESLLQTIAKVDGLVLNDGEARMLAGEQNLITAGKKIMQMGPRVVIIKKGEHGAMMVSKDHVCVLPAYPTENVKDPTGAGDSFAGGMMGYMAEQDSTDGATLRAAMVRGTVTASFAIEDFTLDGLRNIERPQVEERAAEYMNMLPPR